MKVLINFYASINEASINAVINFINGEMHKAIKNPTNPLEEIVIQLSSTGGSSDHGLLAFNYLKQINIPKTLIGMANVDSAAVLLFAAGDKRLAMASCRFTLHEALTNLSGTFTGKKLHEIAYLNERITDDYCQTIHHVAGKNLRTIRTNVREGKVLSSEEAKSYGLVTEIVDSPYITSLEGLNILTVNNPQPNVIQPGQNHTITT